MWPRGRERDGERERSKREEDKKMKKRGACVWGGRRNRIVHGTRRWVADGRALWHVVGAVRKEAHELN